MQLRGGSHFFAFEHLLDQINAPSRAIEFVSQLKIGGTCRQAEATVNTAAQYFLGLSALWGVACPRSKIGLHGQSSLNNLPGLNIPVGSNSCLSLSVMARTPGDGGWKTGTDGWPSCRNKVACPPWRAAALRTKSGSISPSASQRKPPFHSIKTLPRPNGGELGGTQSRHNGLALKKGYVWSRRASRHCLASSWPNFWPPMLAPALFKAASLPESLTPSTPGPWTSCQALADMGRGMRRQAANCA